MNLLNYPSKLNVPMVSVPTPLPPREYALQIQFCCRTRYSSRHTERRRGRLPKGAPAAQLPSAAEDTTDPIQEDSLLYSDPPSNHIICFIIKDERYHLGASPVTVHCAALAPSHGYRSPEAKTRSSAALTGCPEYP